MGCDGCIHKEVCNFTKDIGHRIVNMLMGAFSTINVDTAEAATRYTLASICSHYRIDEGKEISITIVSGDFPEKE